MTRLCKVYRRVMCKIYGISTPLQGWAVAESLRARGSGRGGSGAGLSRGDSISALFDAAEGVESADAEPLLRIELSEGARIGKTDSLGEGER